MISIYKIKTVASPNEVYVRFDDPISVNCNYIKIKQICCWHD